MRHFQDNIFHEKWNMLELFEFNGILLYVLSNWNILQYQYKQNRIVDIIITKIMTMMILMMIIMLVIIIAIMIMMIKIILIIAAVIIINSPFEPGDFSTGSTTVA